jgi:hypothetical protein
VFSNLCVPRPLLLNPDVQHPAFQDLVSAHAPVSHAHLAHPLLLDSLLQHPLLAHSLFAHPLLANPLNGPTRTTTTTIWRKT